MQPLGRLAVFGYALEANLCANSSLSTSHHLVIPVVGFSALAYQQSWISRSNFPYLSRDW